MNKGIKFFAIVVAVLLVMLAGFFVYHFFFAEKTNSYLIKNKYYGFELQAPQNWIAEKNTLYSEDDITQILQQCKKDGLKGASSYEIGAFRFQDQKYPEGFGNAGYLPAGLPTGAIFQITVSCIPDSIKNKIINYSYGNLKIGGEKAFGAFLNLLGFGKTKYISFYHNNFQYKISEYVYISPADKNKNEASIQNSYAQMFNKIISSFKFK
ncbi:MAG: hypothetical protein ABSA74_00160 [Candidatus Staskawiczbacteria bacterium]|jgi:hypothetical protein